MLVQQSTIPTFITESDTITQMRNGTFLFCTNFNSERKNFIVVDEVSIRNNFPSSIQTAFNNGWIKEFGVSSKVNVFRWELNTNNINIYQNLCLFKDILKDRSKVKILIGGNEFDDWLFMDRRKYKGTAGNFYTQHIDFSNGYPSNQSLVIVYREDIREDNSYEIALNRSDGITTKTRDINFTITDNVSNQYYLYDAQILDPFYVRITYRDFNGNVPDRIVNKVYHNEMFVKQFPIGQNLGNKYIEVYSRYTKRSNYSDTNKEFDMKSGSFYNLAFFTNTNRINFNTWKFFRTGEYYFRIFDSDTNEYSDFMPTKMVSKKITIFSTDATLSTKNYEGFIFRPLIKYL